jgi:hypothetical protein
MEDESPGQLNGDSNERDGEAGMFDTLDEQIESTQGRSPTHAERAVRYLVVAVLSVVLFGGLYLGVWFLEY